MAVINCQKSLVLGSHVVKHSCLKPAMIFVFLNFLVATNSLVRKHSSFVGASYKKTKQKRKEKNIDIYLNPEPVNNHAICFNYFMPAYFIKVFHSIYTCIQFSHF